MGQVEQLSRRDGNGRFNGHPTGSIRDRFESQISPEPMSGCWLWAGSPKNRFGHGAFKLGNRKSKVEFAHRVAHGLYKGPIPDGLYVLHDCDNPACVNPNHLRLGTALDNVADMVRRSCHSHGERHCFAKITDDIARDIRYGAASTKTAGVMYGISRQAAADIRYGRTWKHVTR